MQYFNEKSICSLDPGLISLYSSYKGNCTALNQTSFFFGSSSISEPITTQAALFYTPSFWGIL